MLSVRDLRKTFGERPAVDGVGFEIRSGEIYGLLGPNGAGKTMRDFGHLFPTAWAMDAYLGLVFGGASWREVLPEVGVLLAMALALGSFGLLRLRRNFAR